MNIPLNPNEKIPAKVWEEAEKIAGGLYRMNAKYAIGYGFNFNSDTKKICYGIFIHKTTELNELDGWIKF
jgi:hypothetical protein